MPFSPLNHTQKAAGEMSYIHTGSRSSLCIATQDTKVTNLTRRGGGVQKPQARLFTSFLSIFNLPSQNSFYLSNFSKFSKRFKFQKAQAMFILLVKCWRSRSLYCVLSFAPRCWRVAPGFIRIADPLQEVTPKAWRTSSHMGLMTSGPL